MEEEAPFKNKGEKIGISNMQNTKRKLYISSEEKAQNGEPLQLMSSRTLKTHF